jgi:hypothetical protein
MASRNSPIRKVDTRTNRIPEKFKQISFLGNHINENVKLTNHEASKTTENMSVTE